MLVITERIKEKLNKKHDIKHGSSLIRQAFHNMTGSTLIDTREKNLVKGYRTEWFIAKVNRTLYKVVFLRMGKDIVIKTAYAANEIEIALFNDKTETISPKAKAKLIKRLKSQ